MKLTTATAYLEVEGFDPTAFPRVEELFLYRSSLRTIMTGYEELKLTSPEWVVDQLESIESEINSRVKAELKLRLRQAKARRSALTPASEKLAALDSEISMLEDKIKN